MFGELAVAIYRTHLLTQYVVYFGIKINTIWVDTLDSYTLSTMSTSNVLQLSIYGVY